MKTPEKKRVFNQTFSTLNEREDAYLPARQFDDDNDQFVAETSAGLSPADKLNIEPIVRPKRGKKWAMVTIGSLFLGLLGWQSVDSLIQAYLDSDWLVLAWSAFVLGLASFGASRFIREFFILRKLRNHFGLQEQAEQMIDAGHVGDAMAFCEALTPRYHDPAVREAAEVWKNTVLPSHNDAEVLELYDAIVLKVLDDRATRIISHYASDSAVLIAMSPLAMADMFLVAWRSFKMVDDLSELYQIKLGYWARIRLLKLILINMALAGVSEVAIDTGLDLISTKLASKLSARMGQGVGIGLLTARLGIQAMKLLRPVPWFPQTKLKLSSVRKQITGRMVKLFNKEAEK